MSTSTQDFESSHKARKDKKKKHHKDKKDFEETKDSSTPATRVNKAEIDGRKKEDVDEITCYNCNKNGTM